jgi:hypothetical protein
MPEPEPPKNEAAPQHWFITRRKMNWKKGELNYEDRENKEIKST